MRVPLQLTLTDHGVGVRYLFKCLTYINQIINLLHSQDNPKRKVPVLSTQFTDVTARGIASKGQSQDWNPGSVTSELVFLTPASHDTPV